jgi:hypothetical protein
MTLALGGCFEGDQPFPDEPPPIETEYLPDRNAIRLWHAGDDPLTEIDEINLRIHPHDTQTQAALTLSKVEYEATLELPDGTTHRGMWLSTEESSATDYPLQPDEEIFVTGYEKSLVEAELETGDELNLRLFYPDSHGNVVIRGFAEVP